MYYIIQTINILFKLIEWKISDKQFSLIQTSDQSEPNISYDNIN